MVKSRLRLDYNSIYPSTIICIIVDGRGIEFSRLESHQLDYKSAPKCQDKIKRFSSETRRGKRKRREYIWESIVAICQQMKYVKKK